MIDEELDFILDRVNRMEDSRVGYKVMAENWERMWRGDPGFNRSLARAIAEGQEQIILPTPFNVVNLSQRLLSAIPRIDVIPGDPTDSESVDYARLCERWLTLMWRRINYDQRRNVLSDAIWYALVRGRFAFEVKWIKDKLPKARQQSTFPVLIRTIDPLNVGFLQGPYGPEFAYHKYESSLLDVLRRWPDLRNTKRGSKLAILMDNYERNNHKSEHLSCCVIDYWATDPDSGEIYNATLVEDEFAKPYAVTSYPDIPIVCGRGDYAPGLGDSYDGLSILHSIDGLWQYQCRLTSQMATGLMWHFWPAILIQNEENNPVDDLDIAPGAILPVPSGTRVDMVRIDPNVPLAQTVFSQVEAYIQQSTYPEVMYGKAPGELQAGYGVSLLSDAAKGRIKNFQDSLEMTIAHVNRVVLALVEKKAGKKGVDIGIVDEVSKEKYRLTLTPMMIKGNYENEVRITPVLPQDDVNRVVMGKQLADGKYISNDTLRDKFMGIMVPDDETMRIALEEAMQSDEMRNYRLRQVLIQYYGEQRALNMMFEAQAPFMPEPPPGTQWEKDGNGDVKAVPTSPEPPSTMFGGPPMEPPDMGPMGPGGPPGMPPDMGPMSMQPDATLVPPMGGGIPPVLQGQFEGETLGLPQDLDPNVFAGLMGQPLPPAEELRVAAGLPR